MRNRNLLTAVVFAGAAALVAAPAAEAATAVTPPVGNEKSHKQILNRLYGGGFSGTPTNGFSNGSVNVTRVSDANDQVWQSGAYHAKAVASFAKYHQIFGMTDGATGGTFEQLFQKSGDRYNVTGEATFTADGPFRFGRKSFLAQPYVISSLASENRKGLDKLVTYQISGAGFDQPAWLLFWEDVRGIEADGDFNDLVVQLSQVSVAPTPAAMTAGLALLLGAGLRRKRD